MAIKFSAEDNGNCRVYYKEGKALYCWQDDGSWNRTDFGFYRCSTDGEPMYRVTWSGKYPLVPNPESKIGKDLNAFLIANAMYEA